MSAADRTWYVEQTASNPAAGIHGASVPLGHCELRAAVVWHDRRSVQVGSGVIDPNECHRASDWAGKVRPGRGSPRAMRSGTAGRFGDHSASGRPGQSAFCHRCRVGRQNAVEVVGHRTLSVLASQACARRRALSSSDVAVFRRDPCLSKDAG